MSRVLVVDDNSVIASLLTVLLERDGLEAVDASDAPGDLRNPGSQHWFGADALICDLRMPIPGIEILSIAATFHPHVKRIVFTGLSEHDPDVIAISGLADRILHKPEDVTRIAKVVKDLT